MSASLTPSYGEAAPKSRTRDLPLMGEGTCHRTKCDKNNPKRILYLFLDAPMLSTRTERSSSDPLYGDPNDQSIVFVHCTLCVLYLDALMLSTRTESVMVG
ncbi:hypothetical protein DVH24_002721 [Malus domestica]|uniref:Uncharacterized protein n=1 Tax=Malus domestica TaxID=3750 RepID=A0A498KAU5_MALDO|nr:hypothetical protein DVH24_002721 [Malus domestica]